MEVDLVGSLLEPSKDRTFPKSDIYQDFQPNQSAGIRRDTLGDKHQDDEYPTSSTTGDLNHHLGHKEEKHTSRMTLDNFVIYPMVLQWLLQGTGYKADFCIRGFELCAGPKGSY